MLTATGWIQQTNGKTGGGIGGNHRVDIIIEWKLGVWLSAARCRLVMRELSAAQYKSLNSCHTSSLHCGLAWKTSGAPGEI
jgi:hypothetical protein